MAGDLVLNYRDFCQPDNSLDHSVVGKNINSAEVKLKSNARKIYNFETL
jgi:hypothetical protein